MRRGGSGVLPVRAGLSGAGKPRPGSFCFGALMPLALSDMRLLFAAWGVSNNLVFLL